MHGYWEIEPFGPSSSPRKFRTCAKERLGAALNSFCSKNGHHMYISKVTYLGLTCLYYYLFQPTFISAAYPFRHVTQFIIMVVIPYTSVDS